MLTIVITSLVGMGLLFGISLWEECVCVIDTAINENIYSPEKEECNCRACCKRREQAMYIEAGTNPEAFLAEIARSNGNDSMQMIWAQSVLNQK